MLIGFLLTVPSRAEKRVAFVVGIDAYDRLTPEKQLKKAVQDARSVSASLRQLGFTVTAAENAGRFQLNQLWAAFINAIEPGDVAAFYFSGHGVEMGGVNYLIPSDIPPLDPEQGELLKSEALSFETMTEALRQRRARVSLIILDACRNNPFVDRHGKSLGSEGGLARVQPPEGTFVLYAAGVGQRALDRLSDLDPDPNSVFTRTLLPLLSQPGLKIAELARGLKERVRDLALSANPPRHQTPAYYDEVIGDFCLAGCGPPLPPPSRGQCDGVETTVAGERRCLKPVDVFRDCAACPEMVIVPAGSFLMGSDKASDPDHDATEAPRHEVRIAKPFAVGRFEVTFEEWDACVAAGGCNGYRPADGGWGRSRRPVINISWADAQAYVAWLSATTGKPYRLLTEAEWEYAARAGTTTRFTSGDDPRDLCAFGNGAVPWVRACTNAFANRTAPIGQFKANAFGLHDTIGNVWEWVDDCWHASHVGAATDGATRTEAGCDKHVIRGGSWLTGPIGLRAAMRAGVATGYRDDDAGLRILRELQ